MNGIGIYHITLSGTQIFYENIESIGNWAIGGRFRDLTSPNMWWHNGSTYAVGYATNTYNNQVYITKQTGYALETNTVGVGTDGSEPLNHATPLLYINEATGYIYMIQNEFHVDRFKVYKSDNPEDISAFTHVGYFDADGSYLALIKWSGTNCTFTTRSGQATAGYDFNVLEVDLDSPSGYTDTLTVEMSYATNSVRAYLIQCNYYGTNTKRVFGLQSRIDSTSIFYKISLLFSSDNDNFENLAGDHTEDVTSAAISYANLETYYSIIGSDSDKTISISPPMLLQIGDGINPDEIFLAYQSSSTTMTINKYLKGTLSPDATYVLPYTFTIADNEDGYVYLYYNGTYIIGTAKVADGDTRLFRVNTDLTGFEEIMVLPIRDGAYFGMPWNMDDVDDLYLMIGFTSTSGLGQVPYIITNETYT